MYKSFIWLLKLFIFWILLFYVQQIIFLFLNTSYFADISISQFFKALYYGLFMNISSASYLMILPFIFLIISNFTKKDKWIVKTANWIIVFQIILCVITGVIDAGLFSAWGTKLNAKAISYISYPSEMLKGIGSVSLPLLISYLLLITFLSLFCYYKFFKFSIFYKIRFWKFLVFSIFISALLIIGSRGGLQTRPINKGWAFHSTNQCLNYSAVNSLWNFFDIFINREDNNNQYQFFDDEKAKAIVAKMHQYSKDSNEFILTMKHPNIVMILMESISAENMILLGGKEEVMPGLDSLCKYGILFSDFYANGVRTEQGLIALLSGFPAQPANTVIRHFGKFENLPHIGRILLENGYSNNYYYSGNLDYANTKSYLLSGGFSKIIGDEQKWKTKTQWGAYDEEIFDYHLKHSNGDKQPFFSIIMTSTNHEPFEAKVKKVFKGKGTDIDYKNTSYYTDRCIVNYLKQAKQKEWYNNTLFVIVSDHAHSYPQHRANNEPERYHIPMIFFGEVIKPEYKGTVIDKTSSQVDFPSILLNQMGIDSDAFVWSKNLFAKNPPQFAFYTFDNGFGIISPNKYIVYDHNLKKVVLDINRNNYITDTNLVKQGKAYLQILIDEFINLDNK